MLVSLLATIKAATPLIAVSLMAAILFGFQTSVGNIQTLPSDMLSGKSVGTLAGFGGTAAKLAVVGLNFLIPVITVNSYAPLLLSVPGWPFSASCLSGYYAATFNHCSLLSGQCRVI